MRTLAAAAACLLLACPALAEQGWLREIRGGPLWHDVDGLWSGKRVEQGIDWNAEVLFWRSGLGLPFGLGSLHPNLGASINDAGDTSKVYAGVLWDLEAPFGLFLNLGIGGAWHDGAKETRDPDKRELGTRFLFRIPIEVGYSFTEHHRMMATFDHASNGGFDDPNQGLDTLGVRYGYRF